MPTNAQLQAEVDRLTAENARLREQVPNPTPGVPTEFSFGLSEGTEQELAMHGVATDPLTGQRLVAGDSEEDDYEDDEV